jgi:hypothetical protein
MKRFAPLPLALAAVFTCGCGTADTAPIRELAGTFVLASYNGEGLPAYVEPRLGKCSSMIVAGSLTVTEGGRVVFERSYTAPCTPGASVSPEVRTGTASVDGTAVTVALDANTLNAAQVYTGTLAGGALTLHYTVENRTAPLEQTFVLERT